MIENALANTATKAIFPTSLQNLDYDIFNLSVRWQPIRNTIADNYSNAKIIKGAGVNSTATEENVINDAKTNHIVSRD